MPLDYISHPHTLLHLNHPRHPERPERISAITKHLSRSGLQQEFQQVLATPISLERVKQLHHPDLIAKLQAESEKLAATDNRYMLDPDTSMCAHSLSAALLAAGGIITAFFSHLDSLQAFSGIFSALGNIGPSYIPAAEIGGLHPIIKLTYIIGMLAGRLEIFPVLLLFSLKSWR